MKVFWLLTGAQWSVYTLIAWMVQYGFDMSMRHSLTLFLVVGLALNGVHRLGHFYVRHPPLAAWFRAHVIGHHVGAYPPKRVESPGYRLNPYDPYELNSVMYLIVLTIVFFVFQKATDAKAYSLGCLLSAVFGMVILESVVHEEIHRSDTRWGAIPGFHYLRQVHFLHHRSMTRKRNFAVVSLWTDALLGTLVEP